MTHRYLILDAEIGGTGVRDEFEGFIELVQLPLTTRLIAQIRSWTDEYPKPWSRINDGLMDNEEISAWDIQGIDLMNKVQNELGEEYKVRYYSAADCTELILMQDGSIKKLRN